MKIVSVTGGFDPVHSGHLAYMDAAAKLGDHLIVGVNSDKWLTGKKGRPFMPWEERAEVIRYLKGVDGVIAFNDDDGSACDAITQVRELFPDPAVEIIFANGGDRGENNINELKHKDPNLTFRFGVGGDHKQNSSSWILQEWKAPKTERPWGYYRVIHNVGEQTKVKELTVNPGHRLSMQKHQQRAEHWFVAEGTATVLTIDEKSTDVDIKGVYNKHEYVHISKTEWHQLCNDTNEPLKMIEIQYGETCVEEDIERK